MHTPMLDDTLWSTNKNNLNEWDKTFLHGKITAMNNFATDMEK